MRETGSAEPFLSRVRDVITDSLRYWEPRRFVYDGVLLAVVVAHFAAFPQWRSALRADVLIFLFILAVLANVCYCVAYVADLFVQFSGFGPAWQRHRWMLLVVGTLFGAALAHVFCLGFFTIR